MPVSKNILSPRGAALRINTAIALILIAAAAYGFAGADPSPAPAAARAESRGISNHVLLISVDGLRPDAIAHFGAKTLNRLIGEGSYTLSAKTILPSKTLPAHTSMLTGEPPSRHGVTWNNNQLFFRGKIESPTVFSVLRSNGFETAAFFSKSKFQHLQRRGTLDHTDAPGWLRSWSAAKIAGKVEEHLAKNKSNLLFVHLGDPDRAGHDDGWMSPKYGEAVLDADAAIGRILKAADQTYGARNYTVIVTADHGGHDRDHGSDDLRDMMIPWIVWGRGVQPGEISQSVQTMDTASTVLWLFGVSEPTPWAGDPVLGAWTQ